MEPRSDASPKPLSRVELLEQARELRITDADVMTRAELHAALERVRRPEQRAPQPPPTWLGVARRLLASIVEQGLHLPDAARVIRGGSALRAGASGPPPVATVTLARIYAAQGHLKRALTTLDEVLASDPDHDLARELRRQLAARWAERQQEEAFAAASTIQASAATAAAAGSLPTPPAVTSIPVTSIPVTSVPVTSVPVPQSVRAHIEEDGPLSDTAISRGAPPPPRAGTLSSKTGSAGPGPESAYSNSSTPSSNSPPSESCAPDTTTPELESSLFESVAPPPPGPDAAKEHDVFEIETKVDHPNLPRRPALVEEPLAPPSQLPPPPLPAPEVEPAVALSDRAQNAASVAAAEPESAPEPAALEPRPAGLVLIQTDTPEAYLYWELERLGTPAGVNGSPAPRSANGTSALARAVADEVPPTRSADSGSARGADSVAEPHWISIVIHTARGAGSERRERRFPVFQASGTVRLEGLPKGSVVRAKLARGEAPEARPLVIAGSVWAAEAVALGRAETRFQPHIGADPRALALRAGEHLVNAVPIYW